MTYQRPEIIWTESVDGRVTFLDHNLTTRQIVEMAECPTCNAPAGEACRLVKGPRRGERASKNHGERAGGYSILGQSRYEWLREHRPECITEGDIERAERRGEE